MRIILINQKKVENSLRKIALNEFKVKRPQSVKLLKLKPTQIFSKGSILKILSVSQIKNPYYAIVEQRQDELTEDEKRVWFEDYEEFIKANPNFKMKTGGDYFLAKAWGLLKDKNDYLFFHRITRMLSAEKLSEFGEDSLKDLQTLTDIVKNGNETDAKIYIDGLKDRKRKILAADTYFTILRTYSSLYS